MAYILYGKRTGKKVNGVPVFDKTFRALNYQGVRVNKLADAGTYATRADAEEVISRPSNKEIVDKGLVIFEIRKAR